MTISAAVVTHNEEKNISNCLKSLSWVNEIIIIDGRSSDNTVKIAKKFTPKIFIVENQPLMKKNMNLAFTKCSSDWILSIDADEQVTPELQSEIKKTIQLPEALAVYKLPRKNIIFNKWIEHSGWYPDYQTRLFKKGQAKFPEKSVHEELTFRGEAGKLANPLIHHHYSTVSEFLSPHRIDGYTSAEMEKLINEGKKIAWYDAIGFPFHEFLRRFFDWQGYKDGLHGLVLSLLMAFYWEIVFVKMWEKEKFWQYNNNNFLEEFNLQIKNSANEYHHWLAVNTKGVIKRLSRKVRNRLL